jgi:hypothetical protein
LSTIPRQKRLRKKGKKADNLADKAIPVRRWPPFVPWYFRTRVFTCSLIVTFMLLCFNVGEHCGKELIVESEFGRASVAIRLAAVVVRGSVVSRHDCACLIEFGTVTFILVRNPKLAYQPLAPSQPWQHNQQSVLTVLCV